MVESRLAFYESLAVPRSAAPPASGMNVSVPTHFTPVNLAMAVGQLFRPEGVPQKCSTDRVPARSPPHGVNVPPHASPSPDPAEPPQPARPRPRPQRAEQSPAEPVMAGRY